MNGARQAVDLGQPLQDKVAEGHRAFIKGQYKGTGTQGLLSSDKAGLGHQQNTAARETGLPRLLRPPQGPPFPALGQPAATP